jgi:hypothetical protein
VATSAGSVVDRLRYAAENGLVAEFARGETITATMVREILLALPRRSPPTAEPVALRIKGATIDRRIELDRVAVSDGGAIAPIEFVDCELHGGFTGARSHFSSLRFKDCTFVYPARSDLEPTIDLSAARIDTGLQLRALRPAGADDTLSIRAPNLRVAGALDLSCSHLRAQEDVAGRLYCDPPVACLDLAEATIGGDVYLLNGVRAQGRIYARGVHIEGNLWMWGTTVEAPGRDALFLQRATIGGSVLLGAQWDRANDSGPRRSFICKGNLNLRAATVGTDLHLTHAFVAGIANFLDLKVNNDLVFGAAVRDGVDLTGCRIGGSIRLSGLIAGCGFKALTLTDAAIGRSLQRRCPALEFRLLAARRAFLKSMPDVLLVETLWATSTRPNRGKAGQGQEKPEETAFQAAFLVKGDSVVPLDGFASGLAKATKAFEYDLTSAESAVEFLFIHGLYAHGDGGFPVISDPDATRFPPSPVQARVHKDILALPPGFFKVDASAQAGAGFRVEACVLYNGTLSRCAFSVVPGNAAIQVRRLKQIEDGPAVDRIPIFLGPFLCHPTSDKTDLRRLIDQPVWIAPPALAGMTAYDRDELPDLRNQLVPHLLETLQLRGEIDLRSAGCELLEDECGSAWGPRSRVKMDHFVYRQTTGPREAEPVRKSTQKRFLDWMHRLTADHLWLPLYNRLPARWRNRAVDREPWQQRRNWIYQQYPAALDLPSPVRYKIDREEEYRSQPLEQAIRVARAEGREDVAIEFEKIKNRVEWRLFNRRNRWGWAALAIILAASWLVGHGGSWAATVPALLITLILMAVVSWTRDILDKYFFWLGKPARRRLRTTLFYLPALGLLLGEWTSRPFHFIVAFFIFASVRLISVFAHAVMRWGFGYLRQPVRAIITLVLTFFVGWAGVYIANARDMLVVKAEPAATLVGRHDPHQPARPPGEPLVMGSPNVADGGRFVREISCAPEISEPLYALDVLIPIIDLGEESRCEIRRMSAADRSVVHPNDMGIGELIASVPDMPFDDHRFWWWMKALYAIAGWFIVSLSILTFAQANRTHAEPPTEKG